MNIKQIRLENFKNIENSTITFKNNMSGIYGPNGTGKTAIIEAVELLKNYFHYGFDIRFFIEKDPTNNSEKFKDFMKIGKTTMTIEAVLSDEKNDYKVSITVKKDNEDNIYVSEEKISVKPSNTRKKFVNVATLSNEKNSIIPEIIIGKTKYTEEDLKNITRENNFKKIITFHIACNSFFSILSIIILKSNIKQNVEIDTFMSTLINIKWIIGNIIVLSLEKQSLYNGFRGIPIHCSFEGFNTTIYYSKKENVYDEGETICLTTAINDISELLSVIIPNSKLILESKIVGYEEETGKNSAIYLSIKKNGIEVPLTSESTGTIKLVSLLSVLVSYIKDEKATVLIDELDIHIFEYLLAVLLETIGPIAKGQLIFTGHNLLPMERLGKDSIIIATKSDNDVVYTFMKGISATTNIRQKYLKSQSYWSEDNIEPLMLNIPALELFVKKLVL